MTQLLKRLIKRLIPLTVAATCLLLQQVAQAKPQIKISCCTPGNPTPNYVGFGLYWGSTGNSSWPNYITTDIYNSTGTELTSYPQEDPTVYYIPATQLTAPSCNSPTGSEFDTPPGAATVVISVSGEWNGASCPPQNVAPVSPTVRHSDKRHVPGQPMQFNQWLEVTNSTSTPAELRFVYALFKKTDPDMGNIIPLTETDPQGNRHIFRRIRHNGSTRYTIPNTPNDYRHIITDLRIDLSQGVNPTDYVYLDVFVVDITNQVSKALRRVQVYP